MLDSLLQDPEQLFRKALQFAEENDYASAARCYQQAAEYGHLEAQNNLGLLYKDGKGVEEDKEKALSLFINAANAGSLLAIKNVVSCYVQGVGTWIDYEQAIFWLERAAEYKDKSSCVLLAKIYKEQYNDMEKELYWRKKAAEYGSIKSKEWVENYYASLADFKDDLLVDGMFPISEEEPEIKLENPYDLYVEKTIGETDIKYNICTFGAKFHIGFDRQIKISFNGTIYEGKTHKTVKGRVGGLKTMYTENHIGVGDVLQAGYWNGTDMIIITKQ